MDQSGATNGGIASIGYIWGFKTGEGWVLLWKDQLGNGGTYYHPNNNNWYRASQMELLHQDMVNIPHMILQRSHILDLLILNIKL